MKMFEDSDKGIKVDFEVGMISTDWRSYLRFQIVILQGSWSLLIVC